MKQTLKTRKTRKISKRKMVNIINLFERYVDDEIKSVDVYGLVTTTSGNQYRVNLAENSIQRSYRDPDWS